MLTNRMLNFSKAICWSAPSVAPWLALAILLAAGVARADPPPTAKARFQRGMAAYAVSDYEAAIQEWSEGFRAEPLPAFLYNIGQAHAKRRENAEAIEFYRRYLDLAPAASDRAEVEARIAELERASAPPPPSPAITPPQSVPPIIAPLSAAPAIAPRDDAKVKPPALVSASLIAAPREKPSIVRRGWFWGVVVGGVAIAATGIALGGVYGRPAPSSGTLPEVTVR